MRHRESKAGATVPGLILATGLLAGCGGLHSRGAPEQVWVLRPSPVNDAATASSGSPITGAVLGTLRVDTPDTAPGLDTDRILLLRRDHRLDVYAGNRWSAPTPALVEALAVAALRDSGAWQAVEDSDSRFPTEYRLEIRIRRFEAEAAAGGAPEVHVALFGLLGRRESGRVLASLDAASSEPAQTNTMTAVVAAFDTATARALKDLVAQAQAAARKAPAEAPAPDPPARTSGEPASPGAVAPSGGP